MSYPYERENEEIEESSRIMTRIPPNDIEAEQAVLGSMFFGQDAISVAYEKLKPEDFYRADNRVIFEAMIDLYVHNIPVDFVTLRSKLDELQLTEQAGGREYLIMLTGYVSTSANILHYIKIIEKMAMRRRLIQAGQDITTGGYDYGKEIDEVVEDAEKAIFNISQNRNTSDFVTLRDALVDSIEEIEKVYKNKGASSGISTGFADFDRMTAGLHPSDLVLIAARPSVGKTALALKIAQNVAVRQGVPTAIFSLEMSSMQLVNRLLCAEAMIDSHKLRTGELDPTDWEKIVSAVGPLGDAPLYIDDTPGITTQELRSKCRKLKLEKGLELIVIDYLQLMSGSKRTSESRQQEISEISRNLKAIAREMKAPVIALSQLSRAVESRADHRPMLSDLRESGAIEQDADVVSFLYRDEYYNPDTEKKNIAEVIIAKQRNGPTGTVELMYLNQYTKFVSIDKQGI
ncbi:MAG: replicative DNA helicase [Clostridiales bacterium]|jgi:replicative DNA helicase|nr:replicative DNA helicase [Clostridiales bacterium]